MGDQEIPTDSNEEMPVDETELLMRTAEQLLSESESASPRVYVLEMISVLPKRTRRKAEKIKAITPQYNSSMLPILALVDKVAIKVWRGPQTVENGIVNLELAIVADRGILESLGLGGESIWLRAVESDELFETEDIQLLLQPRQVREVVSDFVCDALQTGLSENWNDARLAVLHAAAALLLENLEEDICLIPDRFGEVVEAIDEVLSEVDWFGLTKESVLNLSGEVIRRVADT